MNLQYPRVTFFAYLVAAVETLIAVALIAGFARKLTYLSAIAFSLLIWSTAEGFGGPYTSGPSDIGTAVIHAIVFTGLLTLSYHADVTRYSVDHLLEKKITWWWRIADVRRRPVPGTAVRGPVPAAAVPGPDIAAAIPPPDGDAAGTDAAASRAAGEVRTILTARQVARGPHPDECQG